MSVNGVKEFTSVRKRSKGVFTSVDKWSKRDSSKNPLN